MHRLMDKLLLFIFCFTNILFLKFHISFVISFFLSLALSSAIYFFNSKRFCLWVTIFYGIGAYFYPPLYLFLPLILYDMLQFRCVIAIVITMIGSLLAFRPDMNFTVFFIISGCVFAFVLQYKTRSFQILAQTYKQTRDDSTESNYLLSEKNRTILENQDYEIYTATLQERNRIAREIHDNVGHMLSRSILMVGALKALNKDLKILTSLEQLSNTLTLAMNSIRSSVHDLHDESINLKEVLNSLVENFTSCSITSEYDMGLSVSKDVKYCFISITKEALSNIIKHSNATDVHIIIREQPSLYQLLIKDNGTSLNIKNTGMGLSNMKERVYALHGNIQIRNDSGFRIFITIPKTERTTE